MVGHRLQEVECADAGLGHSVPEEVVAPSPDQPHVAAFHLIACEFEGSIHIVEIIFIGGGERGGASIGAACFILNVARFAAGNHQQKRR